VTGYRYKSVKNLNKSVKVRGYLLDIEPGAVSIMGLMNDRDREVQLLIDEDVLKDEYVGCHPCVCTSSLKLRTKDVMEKFLPATGHVAKVVHLVGED